MSCIGAHDQQLARLADAIAQRVGPQRFHVWFNNSTRLDLKQDGLEIAVPNDFISEWIGSHFSQPIQEAAHEVLGCSLAVRFSVVPQLFEIDTTDQSRRPGESAEGQDSRRRQGRDAAVANAWAGSDSDPRRERAGRCRRGREGGRLGDRLEDVAGDGREEARGLCRRSTVPCNRAGRAFGTRSKPSSSGRAISSHTTRRSTSRSSPGHNTTRCFIHGGCGLGKTHLLQGLCRRFISHHPTKRWTYLTGEEFTNEFLTALRGNKIDVFRRKMRDLDLLVIDDVHFLGGKKATQEEFLHTFNAIEAMGRQVVIASDDHPKMIEEFGESLINRFVSGMVVRIDPPNFATRCEILRSLSLRGGMSLPEEVVGWIARRVTQNVRELEGAITRVAAPTSS